MSLQTILALRQERAALTEKAGRILTNAKRKGRKPSSTELAKFNRMHDDADKLRARIVKLEKDRKASNTPANLRGQRRDTSNHARINRALRAFVLGSAGFLAGAEDVALAKSMGLYPRGGAKASLDLRLGKSHPRSLAEARTAQAEVERRAMSTTPAAGGYGIPEGFVSTVEVAMLAFGGMREAAQVIRTASGQDLPFPTVDDTGNVGAILAENVAAGEQDVAMGQLVLEAYKYTSKLVRVSIELLQDEAVNIQELLGRLLGERVARILNQHFTTGSGVGQPNGVVTASANALSAASATAVTRNELVQLKHAVDPAYRQNGRWMFKDSTLASIKQLVDGDGRPLWQAGIGEGEPDRLDGDPYIINQDMPAMTTGQKAILYGDFSKYMIRDVLDLQLLVLRERYAEYGQVGFLIFSRHDGDLLDAGTNPVQHLDMA